MLNIVDIRDDNPCPSDREHFSANYTSKGNFISELACVKYIMYSSDADTSKLL